MNKKEAQSLVNAYETKEEIKFEKRKPKIIKYYKKEIDSSIKRRAKRGYHSFNIFIDEKSSIITELSEYYRKLGFYVNVRFDSYRQATDFYVEWS